MIPVPSHPTITTPFGKRGPHWSCSRDEMGNGIHTGADFAAPVGTTVVAARPGKAVYCSHGAAFGNHQLEVVYPDGSSDFYAHMSKRTVKNGASVEAGQKIGEVGAEGNATGPHLHFERWKRNGMWNCLNVTDPKPSLDWEAETPRVLEVHIAHLSLQYSISRKEKESDIGRTFEREAGRGASWITGTEAGRGAGSTTEVLTKMAEAYGFKLWHPGKAGLDTDCWIAVSKDAMVTDRFVVDYVPVIPASRDLYKSMGVDFHGKPRWGEKGLITVSFDAAFGPANVCAAHYLTKARHPDAVYAGINHFQWNKKLGKAIGHWAQVAGAGRATAWYGGDQNMNDKRNDQPQGDMFFGAPLTSCWDELEKWPNTGHGTIDVIATYDNDSRVSCVHAAALNDQQFRLHQDHYLVEAVYEVTVKKGAASSR